MCDDGNDMMTVLNLITFITDADDTVRWVGLFSIALHIHVSVECKALLDNIGGYHLVERGLVDIKASLSLHLLNAFNTQIPI